MNIQLVINQLQKLYEAEKKQLKDLQLKLHNKHKSIRKISAAMRIFNTQTTQRLVGIREQLRAVTNKQNKIDLAMLVKQLNKFYNVDIKRLTNRIRIELHALGYKSIEKGGVYGRSNERV